jgi:hypothetical protein
MSDVNDNFKKQIAEIFGIDAADLPLTSNYERVERKLIQHLTSPIAAIARKIEEHRSHEGDGTSTPNGIIGVESGTLNFITDEDCPATPPAP